MTNGRKRRGGRDERESKRTSDCERERWGRAECPGGAARDIEEGDISIDVRFIDHPPARTAGRNGQRACCMPLREAATAWQSVPPSVLHRRPSPLPHESPSPAQSNLDAACRAAGDGEGRNSLFRGILDAVEFYSRPFLTRSSRHYSSFLSIASRSSAMREFAPFPSPFRGAALAFIPPPFPVDGGATVKPRVKFALLVTTAYTHRLAI